MLGADVFVTLSRPTPDKAPDSEPSGPPSGPPSVSPAQALQSQQAGHDASVRKPVHAVCLIDVSGSMDDLASGGSDQGLEGSAFTRLDLAKHSMATLIESLGPEDSLTVLSFDESVYTIFPTQTMCGEAKIRARASITGLHTLGGTSIWAALQAALKTVEAFHKANSDAAASTIILLTDGQENSTRPEGGTVNSFAHALATLGNAKLTLHTLGYGYGVDSSLLMQLAQSGNGAYGFIPDATMVGTVFVNFVATMLATVHAHLQAELRGPPGASLFGLSRDERIVNLGVMQSGQQRSLHVIAPPGWQGEVVFRALQPNGSSVPLATQTVDFGADALSLSRHSSATYARLLLASKITQWLSPTASDASEVQQQRQSQFEALCAQITAMHSHARPEEADYLAALLSDLTGDTEATGQIGKALSDGHMQRWGRHYLAGVALCHGMQISQNFKDASLQFYRGELFTQLQANIEALFCLLPAPKATGRARGGGGPSPTSMASFYNMRGGCFHGTTRVKLAGGALKAIADLVRDDLVLTSDGTYRRVDCLVVSPRSPDESGEEIELYDVDGVLLTAYHPVHTGTAWAFPIDCGVPRRVEAAAVFNVLLERGAQDLLAWPSLSSDEADGATAPGVRCITLAHEITDDPVAFHEYLGSLTLRTHLQCMQGWMTGRIVIDESKTVRNPITRRVERWVEAIPTPVSQSRPHLAQVAMAVRVSA
jgi:hypothetical protein